MRWLLMLVAVLGAFASPKHRALEARLVEVGRLAQHKHLTQMRQHVFKPCPATAQ